MADLTTLDPTAPLDTDPAAQGAAQIRTERADLLGWAAVEHALTGLHMFPRGGTGSRPAAGNAGRIYINTDLNAIQYDNGSAWVTIGGIPSVQRGYSQNLFGTGLITSYQDLVPQISLSTNSGQALLAIAFCVVIIGGPASVADFRVLLDGNGMNPGAPELAHFNASARVPLTIPAFDPIPSAGTHIIKFQGKIST